VLPLGAGACAGARPPAERCRLVLNNRGNPATPPVAMVRIIPNRLKPGYSSSSNTNSSPNSRNASPMRSKGDSASPEGRKETGLVLGVVVIRVWPPAPLCTTLVPPRNTAR